MKYSVFTSMCLLLAILLGTSCKDPCKSVICLNGVCEEGTCICNKGFEGEDCSIKSATKFIGNWYISESCTSGPAYYTSNITADVNAIDGVIFDNLYLSSSNFEVIKAVVDGSSLTIASQAFNSGAGTMQGSGYMTVSEDTIHIDYWYVGTPSNDTCHAMLERL